MAIEGEIAVTLDWDGTRVRRVIVRSSRPFAASRVLVGREPSVAVAMAPRLFSICAQAQAAASSSAVAMAGGAPLDTSALALLERRVLLENVQEYLWRLLIDLPKAMGGEPVFAPVGAARAAIVEAIARSNPTRGERAALARLLERTVSAHVFGMPSRDWLAIEGELALASALARATTVPAALLARLLHASPLAASDVALMPDASAEALREAVVPSLDADNGFVREPRWNGHAAETGALARMRSHRCIAALLQRHRKSVATRIAARMFELAQMIEGLGARSPSARAVNVLPLAEGVALSALQTARGLLLHRAHVAGGLVRDYRIVAPTEWNFHPDGPLARGLDGHAAHDEATLVRDARLAVQALDPCVGCRLEVGHA